MLARLFLVLGSHYYRHNYGHFPFFYAVLENDLRRVLCYSKINQIGFMVVAIGIGTELAIDGAIAHAFNHVLYKESFVRMCLGAVIFRTGEIRATHLGGLFKNMPWTTGFTILGPCLFLFPLFCGFVGKSIIITKLPGGSILSFGLF